MSAQRTRVDLRATREAREAGCPQASVRSNSLLDGSRARRALRQDVSPKASLSPGPDPPGGGSLEVRSEIAGRSASTTSRT